MLKWPGPEVRVRASTYGLLTVGALLIVAVLCGDPNRKVGSLIYDYQTLIAGSLAIVAAIISLAGPKAQIAHNEKLQQETAFREEYAAKAMLPLALNYITEYARSCIKLTEARYEESERIANPIRLPEFDRSNLSLVRDCVRYAPAIYRDRLVALLSAIQIMEAFAVTPIDTYPEFSLLLRCVDVDYLCSILIAYARGQTDKDGHQQSLNTPAIYIRTMLTFHSRGVDFWPSLNRHLDRREQAETNQ